MDTKQIVSLVAASVIAWAVIQKLKHADFLKEPTATPTAALADVDANTETMA